VFTIVPQILVSKDDTRRIRLSVDGQAQISLQKDFGARADFFTWTGSEQNCDGALMRVFIANYADHSFVSYLAPRDFSL